ncbi:MAG: DUF1543 domain-containing protein [Flavobacterium haoranii]
MLESEVLPLIVNFKLITLNFSVQIYKISTKSTKHPVKNRVKFNFYYFYSMKNEKLHMIMLGCTPKGRITEQHDIFFGIAPSLFELKTDLYDFWPEAENKCILMHGKK